MMIYPIKPCPKPRMTQQDKWRKRPCVMRYWAFVEECKARGVTLESGDGIIFWLPMPKSWGVKKQTANFGQPHTSRPDLSNLLKALEDAVCPEDSHLWRYASLEKRWAHAGAIGIAR